MIEQRRRRIRIRGGLKNRCRRELERGSLTIGLLRVLAMVKSKSFNAYTEVCYGENYNQSWKASLLEEGRACSLVGARVRIYRQETVVYWRVPYLWRGPGSVQRELSRYDCGTASHLGMLHVLLLFFQYVSQVSLWDCVVDGYGLRLVP